MLPAHQHWHWYLLQLNSEGLGMCEGWISAGLLSRVWMHDAVKENSRIGKRKTQTETLSAKFKPCKVQECWEIVAANIYLLALRILWGEGKGYNLQDDRTKKNLGYFQAQRLAILTTIFFKKIKCITWTKSEVVNCWSLLQSRSHTLFFLGDISVSNNKFECI